MTTFTYPTHPEVRQVFPGGCPKCGKFLVPQEELVAGVGHDQSPCCSHPPAKAPHDGRYLSDYAGPVYTFHLFLRQRERLQVVGVGAEKPSGR